MDTQNQNTGVEGMKEELARLQAQMQALLKHVENKKDAVEDDLASKIARELDHYRSLASKNAHRIYDAGQNGMEEVSDHVRANPLASLLIAFGAGCVISCLFRHLR